jgi:TolA-binding protein
MDCREAIERGVFEDYLHGRLDEAACEEFERLYFEDDECFERLQALLSAQVELGGASRPRPRSRIPTWAASAAASLAAVAFGWVLWQPQNGPAPPPGAALRPSVLAPSPAVHELGIFEAPPFHPMTLRGPDDRAFYEAMAAYEAADWTRAIQSLETFTRANPDHVPAHFFLAASYALADRPTEASDTLRFVAGRAESAYAEEARFYLAKTLLRLDGRAEAQRLLDDIASDEGDFEWDAMELLDAIADARPVL